MLILPFRVLLQFVKSESETEGSGLAEKPEETMEGLNRLVPCLTHKTVTLHLNYNTHKK